MASTDRSLILAIDQGTSATKALLVDRSGAVVGSASAPLGASHPRPGWVEQDPIEVWDSVRAAVRSFDPDDAARVVAVGLSTQRESLVLWDRTTGEPLGPLLGWQDRRTADRCAELLAEGAGPLVADVSGLPLDPMFSALKAQWLLDTYDPGRGRDLCLGTIDSWLLSRFSGGREHVTEIGNASRTQLLDVRRGAWDDRLLELFGVPAAVLGEVTPSDGPFPAVRGLDPVPDGVPVLAVLGDSHAALFAHAGWRPGVVKATYGTGSSVMAVLGGPADAAGGLCLTVGWQHGGAAPTLALEGNIRSSGRTLTWLADLFGVSTTELLDSAGPSAEGVALVPAFGGLGAPWWDADAVATVSGLTLGTGRPALARAAIESVAFQVEDVVAAVEAVGGPIETLLADGGLSRSATVMQAQADLSGRAVRRADDADLSALGAAQLAGVGAGLWSVADLTDRARATTAFAPATTPEQRRDGRAGWHAAIARSRTQPLADTPVPVSRRHP